MIKENDKIADILISYPFLKEKLIKRNKIFKNLNNPVVFNTVGKFAKMSDMAKISGEKLVDILAFLNKEILKFENK
jgi:NitT/TauT family transport system substrate-binding protein